MLDHLKKETKGGAASRLRTYVAALLVLAAVLFGIWQAPRGGPTEDDDIGSLLTGTAEPVEVDLARLPPDEPGAQGRYDAEAIAYATSLPGEALARRAERIPVAELAARPWAEVRGKPWEVLGTVTAIRNEEFGGSTGRLWTVVVEGEEGGRVIVVRTAFSSDPQEGRPEDAARDLTDYLEVGDLVRARGLAVQRRTGTIGDALLKDPVPVLVGVPSEAAFRKRVPAAAPIDDPSEADWDLIVDRYLADTQRWEEPALFQVLQWARGRGAAAIREEIRSGRWKAEAWGHDTFLAWSDELEDADPDADRPHTEGARGKLFRTTGLLGNFVREGWTNVPRMAEAWDVDELYVLDLVSDEYGNAALRNMSPFPLEDYPDLTGHVGQHVQVTGLFLKNFSYVPRRRAPEGESQAMVTVPFFIVLDVKPVEIGPSPYTPYIRGIALAIALLGIVFFLLVRGEGREAARLDERRRALRRRIREGGASSQEGGGTPGGGGPGAG